MIAIFGPDKCDDKFTSISSSFAVMTDPMIPGMIW